jgi:KTSC domain-containing protein
VTERTPTVTLDADEVPDLAALPRPSSNVEAWAYTEGTFKSAGEVGGQGLEFCDDWSPAYLWVRFKGGALYRYAGIPPILWETLRVAPSIGGMLHAKVVGNPDYPCEKVVLSEAA